MNHIKRRLISGKGIRNSIYFLLVLFLIVNLGLVLLFLHNTSSSIILNKHQRNPLIINQHSIDIKPPIVYKRVSRFGRQCNQIIILSMGLSLAKQDNFVLIIDYNSFPVLAKLDLEHFDQTFRGLYIYLKDAKKMNISIETTEILVNAPTYWCGLKIKLESIRTGFRPLKKFQQIAEQEVARMRKKMLPNSDLMSVHVRNYDGLCEMLLPDVCEWRQNYEFFPKPYGCNQTLTGGFLKWIKNDWPEHDWDHRPLYIYLSTDRQMQSVDQSYLDRYSDFGIKNVFVTEATLKTSKVRNEYSFTGEMLMDMWISVLADFYVGMPRSSCDKVVAEWRGIVQADRKIDTVHPRACFSPYYYNQKLAAETCPYIRFLGLDTSKLRLPTHSICAVCELIIALGVAVSKAKKHGMGLHLYGVWGEYIKENLDVESLERELIYVQFREQSEALLFERIQIYNSGKMRGSGIHAEKQIKCATGEYIEALETLKVIPSRKIRQEVEAEAPARLMGYDEHELLNCGGGKSFDFRMNKLGTNKCTHRVDQSTKVTSFIYELWRRVMADEYMFEASSPCSQVIALWRSGMGKKNMCGGFEEYSFSENKVEPSILNGVHNEVQWMCP